MEKSHFFPNMPFCSSITNHMNIGIQVSYGTL